MAGTLRLTGVLAIALTCSCTDISAPKVQCGEPVRIMGGEAGRFGLIELTVGDSLAVQVSRFRHDGGGCQQTWDPAYLYTWRSTDSHIVTVSVLDPTSHEASVLLRAVAVGQADIVATEAGPMPGTDPVTGKLTVRVN